MWYIIVLALSASTNCWAMDDIRKIELSKKDIQHFSSQMSAREMNRLCDGIKTGGKRISAEGDLDIDKGSEYWNGYRQGSTQSREYHLKMAQYYQTLRDACESKESAYKEYSQNNAFHAACLKHLHEDRAINEIKFAREVVKREGFQWVHSFRNSLVAIKNNTLEDAVTLCLPNKSDRFTAYSLNNGSVFAADNTCKVHQWDPHSRWLGVQQLPEVCKEVTAMQELGTYDVVIFFKDKDNNKKAGFLLKKNGDEFVFSVIPSTEQISGITWTCDTQDNWRGTILRRREHLYTAIAQYIIRGWKYPEDTSHVEYIMPNLDASTDTL